REDAMSNPGNEGEALELARLSKPELNEAIADLERALETMEARCLVFRRRIALLRAERLARARNTHFDSEAVAEALLRRVAGLQPSSCPEPDCSDEAELPLVRAAAGHDRGTATRCKS